MCLKYQYSVTKAISKDQRRQVTTLDTLKSLNVIPEFYGDYEKAMWSVIE